MSEERAYNPFASQPRKLKKIFSLEDFEAGARRKLPRPIFGYVQGGAERGVTMKENRAVFDEIGFVPNYVIDVSERRLKLPLLERTYDLPVGIAPMGVSALTSYKGDIALAAAAKAANIPMIVSGASLVPLEEITEVNPDAWFQAYLPRTQTDILALLDRVRRAHVRTLVITVDTAVVPSRENNLRTGYQTPIRPNLRLLYQGATHPKWALGTFVKSTFAGVTHFENLSAVRGSPLLSSKAVRDFSGREFLTWDMLKTIRTNWTGQMVIKGLVSPVDVATAAELGADGVILSNHGGRQLDGTVSPMRCLRAAVQVAGQMPVMIDSGFRRGTDITKALALGAAFVFVGRPFNYAATLDGERGVAYAISLLGSQLRAVLGMLGKTSFAELSPDILFLLNFTEINQKAAPIRLGP